MEVLRRASVVFPDRIPVALLTDDQDLFNKAIALLSENSLLNRWQDDEQRDWVRVHRIIQDVVRADLAATPESRDLVLREVERKATDLMKECTDGFDLITGAALRLHAVTLAERLERLGLQRWESTTALLANVASVARLQGDFADTERRLRQALALLPPDSYDPYVAGRKGRTLLTLAMFHLEWNDTQAALSALEEARRAHDVHRFIPAHNEALAQVLALHTQVQAYLADDEQQVKEAFDKVYALPQLTPDVALVRAATLAKIARRIDLRAGYRSTFIDCTNQLFGLVFHDEDQKPLPAALAHLGLAEAHGSDGGVDAAWRHYCRAMELFSQVSGMDPGHAPDEALDLAIGLLGVYLDKKTEAPHEDIGGLIERILADVHRQLQSLNWSVTQRDWLKVEWYAVRALHLGCQGDVEKYEENLEILRGLVGEVGDLPRNVETLVTSAPAMREMVLRQQVRMLAPRVGIYGPRNQVEPDRPSQAPAPCHHFDSKRPKSPSPWQQQHQGELSGSGLSADRARAIARHSALLLERGTPPNIASEYVSCSLRDVCTDPQGAIDHLIGAWRLLDTMSYKLCDITGHSIEQIRESTDEELIHLHHDESVDTVPARVALRCLNNAWYPELNNVLVQLDGTAMFEMLTSLVHAEDHLAARLSGLTGGSIDSTVRQMAEAASAFDSTTPHRGERTYDSTTGSITVGKDILGRPSTLRLHDPHHAGVDHIFILGDEQNGKSNALRVATLQAAISGVFCIFPADPRNEHGSRNMWAPLVGKQEWIATNIAETLVGMEAMASVIEFRGRERGFERPTPERPGILFSLDDADDVLKLPRGQMLIERIIAEGPAVCVAVAAVIRELDNIQGIPTLLRNVVDSPNTRYYGHSIPESLQHLRAAYGDEGRQH